MGDAAKSANQSKAQVDMRFVPQLPGGRKVFPAEREGRFVWLVSEGAMTPECLTEMRDYLTHIVGNGMWTQNWSGPSRSV
ncbi:hypothetical protein [Streptomyces albogriseolus]|uniref:hypothetical protein n=1 Tax=Streptomyces albogriseolus TaxID=1887 RepID=UPI00382AFDD2